MGTQLYLIWSIAIDGEAWSVCQSVTIVTEEPNKKNSCLKTAESIEMLFVMKTQVSPRNHVSDGGPYLHTRDSTLDGEKGLAHENWSFVGQTSQVIYYRPHSQTLIECAMQSCSESTLDMILISPSM